MCANPIVPNPDSQDINYWRHLDAATTEGRRRLDKLIAQKVGWYVRQGTLYSPDGTLYGGNFSVHIGHEPETPEIIEGIWRDYCPQFTERLDYADSLFDSFPRVEIRQMISSPSCEITITDGGRMTYSSAPLSLGLNTAKCVARCKAWLNWRGFIEQATNRAPEGATE